MDHGVNHEADDCKPAPALLIVPAPPDDPQVIQYIFPKERDVFSLEELQRLIWGEAGGYISILEPPRSECGLLVVGSQPDALSLGKPMNDLASNIMTLNRGDGVVVPILGTAILCWLTQVE